MVDQFFGVTHYLENPQELQSESLDCDRFERNRCFLQATNHPLAKEQWCFYYFTLLRRKNYHRSLKSIWAVFDSHILRIHSQVIHVDIEKQVCLCTEKIDP